MKMSSKILEFLEHLCSSEDNLSYFKHCFDPNIQQNRPDVTGTTNSFVFLVLWCLRAFQCRAYTRLRWKSYVNVFTTLEAIGFIKLIRFLTYQDFCFIRDVLNFTSFRLPNTISQAIDRVCSWDLKLNQNHGSMRLPNSLARPVGVLRPLLNKVLALLANFGHFWQQNISISYHLNSECNKFPTHNHCSDCSIHHTHPRTPQNRCLYWTNNIIHFKFYIFLLIIEVHVRNSNSSLFWFFIKYNDTKT